MIANARMYSVSAQAGQLWRELLSAIVAAAGLDIEVIDYAAPAPLDALWRRSDLAAVFMCGLPYSLSSPAPQPLAVPVPSPPEFAGLPQYWSEIIVHVDSAATCLEDTFGGRLALTASDSQSGSAAMLKLLMDTPGPSPRYREIIAPQITPVAAAAAVAGGFAEVAPLDAYAFRLMQIFCPEISARIKVVGRTASTPMPMLVASHTGFEPLQNAFLEAHRGRVSSPLMQRLMLARFCRPESDAYAALRTDFERSTRYWQDHALASVVHPAFVV